MTEATEVDITLNLQDVRNRIQIASDKAGASTSALTATPVVQLVAVSKTKPIELLMAAYEQGNQRLFGENYVQELIDKAQLMPSDVHWHFIGTLQSNKVNGLIKAVVPRVASLTVETVSTLKLAMKLNTAMQTLKNDPSFATAAAAADSGNTQMPAHQLLPIFVQINTSGEDTKGGIEPDQAVALCQDIATSCDQLVVKGLMTIGAEGDLSCFESLYQCRERVAEALNVPTTDLALSMGMSGDFEAAILQGATHVRIGSTIFGARDYSQTAKMK